MVLPLHDGLFALFLTRDNLFNSWALRTIMDVLTDILGQLFLYVYSITIQICMFILCLWHDRRAENLRAALSRTGVNSGAVDDVMDRAK
ncbi:conserved hypothetical protein [Ricinus communis]|uniref:Uncharacterized protein n=1 Tax=Ricinus communis TaxID=3988 RepID=B9RMC1_RICCO|nr:conserved hypothetical protein [Ricinus communis]